MEKINKFGDESTKIMKFFSMKAHFSTYYGHGSIDTKIMKFFNMVMYYSEPNIYFTENHSIGYNDNQYDNQSGLEIEIKIPGLYEIYCMCQDVNFIYGISINSSQLTTDISTINIKDRLMLR